MFRKVIVLAVLSVLLISKAESKPFKWFGHDHCPDYSAMDGIEMEKLLGTWYAIVDDPEHANDKISCIKHTWTANDNNCTWTDVVSFVGYAILILALRCKEIQILKFKSYLKSRFTKERNRQQCTSKRKRTRSLSFRSRSCCKDFFGKKVKHIDVDLVVKYTDYENILVYYACNEVKHYFGTRAIENYGILVRDRSFDSLSKFLKVAGKLLDLDVDLNELHFIYNGEKCSN